MMATNGAKPLEINEALARLEIQNVLWRYARGVDRGDYDTMASVYHPDGTDEHVDFKGLGTDFARGLTDRFGHMSTVGQHHITNVIIEMDGDDDARVESYFLSFHPYEAGGSVRMGIAAGRYLDHFQCREGEWKILARPRSHGLDKERLRGATLAWRGSKAHSGSPEMAGRRILCVLRSGEVNP